MTSPEPVAPNEGPSRTARPSAVRRVVSATRSDRAERGSTRPGAPGEVAVTREPRVTVSRTANGSRPGRASADTSVHAGERSSGATSTDSPSETGDDVLDRLSRLGDAPAAPEADEPIGIPMIVEADPTYPPLGSVTVPEALRDPSVGTVRGTTVADRADATTVVDGADVPDAAKVAGVAGVAGVVTVPADASGTATVDAPSVAVSSDGSSDVSSAVSTDLPTEAIGLADSSAALDGTDTAVPFDRTDVAPLVLPDVVPQLVPPPGPIPMTPSGDVAVDESTGMTLPVRRLRAPLVFRRAKPRVRRVTRVVRHVDTWSVFKVALVFNVILYLVCLTAGVLLWNVAHATGTIDNVERFFEQFGWETFEFRGGEIYHNAWIGGLFVVIGLTGFAVLLATLFNLITDLVGGIRVSVLEEEVIATPRRPGDPTGSTASTGIPRP